ncbi:DUF11 domain-containing protein [Spirosoma flavum]|uniref:DUF11 domain-containing protein n=1 Tax=Spirosoma flavum TaxID=2048557 RepID=A0ABW6ALZ1_9BACT
MTQERMPVSTLKKNDWLLHIDELTPNFGQLITGRFCPNFGNDVLQKLIVSFVLLILSAGLTHAQSSVAINNGIISGCLGGQVFNDCNAKSLQEATEINGVSRANPLLFLSDTTAGTNHSVPVNFILPAYAVRSLGAQAYNKITNRSFSVATLKQPMDLALVCSLTATATVGLCITSTNTYSSTVVVTMMNPAVGILTVSDGPQSQTFTVTTSDQSSFTAVFSGVASDGSLHTVTASLPECSTTTTYTAPGSCNQPTGTQLTLTALVDKSRAQKGEVLTYTLLLSNVGTTTATNVVVRDSSATGLTYVTNSATAPTGTTFTQGTLVSTWSIASISSGQSLRLTFQAIADSSGILYTKATIPGDTATVCTSIPVKVCTGDTYTFRLTAPAGRSSYRWFNGSVELTTQTTNTLDITEPGTYSLAVDNVSGSCPDFSCCPFIIEEDTLPSFKAMTSPVSCVGNTAQADGRIVLSGYNSAYRYQYSVGADFNEAASLSGKAQLIPVGGVLVSNLSNPVVTQAYTIRVYNSSGCYTDMTVLLEPSVCTCPAVVCIPYMLGQTKRAKRVGDER